MPRTLPKRSGYLASLDGWRAVAILGVLFIHEPPLVIGRYSLGQIQRFGSLGVVLFFAISGILIAGRILEEESLTGRFHLKLFYIRRLFRIQPCMWAYLLVIAVLMLAGILHEAWSHWLGALFLYENFLYHEADWNERIGYFTGHFWTLAVEEHFYLLISLALFFIRRRRVLIFGLLLLGVKVAQTVLQHHTPDPLLRRTYWQIHILLWPAWAAMLLREPAVRTWAIRWLKPWLVLGVTLTGALLATSRSPGIALQLLGYSFTLWVISTMLHPESLTTRVLEWHPLRFLGRLSYSIYVWQVLFYSKNSPAQVDSHLLLILSERPWKYVATACAALLSYYLIEKPMIRLGHRLAPPVTEGRGDLQASALPVGKAVVAGTA